MELDITQKRKELYGSQTLELTAPGGLKIKATSGGVETSILNENVPEGKKWSVVLVVSITQSDL